MRSHQTDEDEWRRALADRAAIEPGCERLVEFLRLRTEGRRDEALHTLRAFAREADAWEPERRLRFAAWYLAECEERLLLGGHFGLSRAVSALPLDDLLGESLDLWLAADPTEPEPYRWAASFPARRFESLIGDAAEPGGVLPRLRLALQADPYNPRSLVAFALAAINELDYATHELPHGLLGAPDELTSLADEAHDLAARLHDPELRATLMEELTVFRAKVVGWNGS